MGRKRSGNCYGPASAGGGSRAGTSGRGGEKRYYDTTIGVIRDDEGAFVGSVGTLRDLTERKHHERKLQDKNERLDRFASIVSHDLRNPLGIARTYLDFARDTGDVEDFDAIEEALDRMDEMIDGLLSLAREGGSIDHGDLERHSIDSLAAQAWEHVADDRGRLVIETDVAILADGDRVLHVFENLFRNALEHATASAPDDGREPPVTIRVGDQEDGFFVADDGPGIPEAERNAVFEYGHSLSDGTGLGLAVVDEIVRAHGWTVSVTESDSGGARFDIVDVETDPL